MPRKAGHEAGPHLVINSGLRIAPRKPQDSGSRDNLQRLPPSPFVRVSSVREHVGSRSRTGRALVSLGMGIKISVAFLHLRLPAFLIRAGVAQRDCESFFLQLVNDSTESAALPPWQTGSAPLSGRIERSLEACLASTRGITRAYPHWTIWAHAKPD